MSKPSAPAAPDYTGAAQAQGAANVDAARLSGKMNNPNVVNPYGSQTITWNGDQPTVTQAFSPDQQKLFDQGNRIDSGLNDLAEGGIGRVGQMMGTSFNPSNLSAMTNNVSPTTGTQYLKDMAPGTLSINGSIPNAGNIQNSFAKSGIPLQSEIGQAQNGIQGRVGSQYDTSGQQVADALYRRQQAQLDPQYQQTESDMRTRLANQGIMQGSDAYNRETGNFNRQKELDYGDARDRSILAAGQEQTRLNDVGLSRANLSNTANNQEISQLLARASLANSTNQQEFNQNKDLATFANQAQGQQFGQNAANAAFGNSAQAQEFGQNLDYTNAYNTTTQNTRNSMFGQDLAAGQFGNQTRQQSLQEQLAMRQLPLNEINALRSGTQVQLPQFQQYQGQSVQPTPVMQGVQAQDQANMSRYNASAAGSNNLLNGMFSLGSAGILSYPWGK